MDDLISRKAALELLGEPHPLDSNAVAAVQKIIALPAVEAVPLDKLCEWLAEHYGSPCQLAEIDCYQQCEPDENGECYGMRTDDKRCWHDYLTKWMEGIK